MELNYGYWTVISKNCSRPRYWRCRCVCGTVKEIFNSSLKKGLNGGSRSCGCKRQQLIAEHGYSAHGYSKTKTYRCYNNMLARCYNKKNPGYHNYGGRGIKVCMRWKMSFENFLADIGECPSPKHSLDRYPNNDGNYEPGNVRWATKLEQSRNTRRNKRLELNGENLTVKEWATRLGISEAAIKGRLRRKWPIEKVLSIGHRSAKERLRTSVKSKQITYQGQTKSLIEWAELLRIKRTALSHRLKIMSVQEAFTLPYTPRTNYKRKVKNH